MSVIFATLLPVLVLTVIQQAVCHEPIRSFFRCGSNWLGATAGFETKPGTVAEVYFFCTATAAAQREKPIFLVISLLERRIVFLSAFLHILPS